ncbi:hypothetical protein K450DRAFT_225326 [Umbelopsis ramanniana AG]|uniref:DUF1748-domain-containing protein n=1 Tax=Umbelopsis ramanniana AG TaxID=1314678 RepID=A0AAD5EGC7_UMBRA|nr:uncharacterized protein K450DRAFT_225326 [Umbelopsis ramanniana AG]KAI8582892.1 hypothetical protein K450DRAFT_225326 [Umbelopsis ramanniana AG]
MTMFGKVVHFAADAVLVSTVLAGIKRSTGLQPATSTMNMADPYVNKSIIDKYLDIGDWVLDTTADFMKSSPYFEKKP